MKHPEGLIGWVDLVTTDTARAARFYGELFDWTAEEMPTPMGVNYTQFSRDGQLVAGMGPLPPDMAAAGRVSSWNSYAIVADADAVVARVAAAGGAVVMPPMDVMDQGRMAMIADPSGATLGLWQPDSHQGAEVFNVPGSLTWNELQSLDVEAAKAFYADVLGWVWEDGPEGGYSIGTVPAKESEDKSNAGAMAMPPNVPEGVPSFWLVYFAVSDCDAAMAAAEELGGSVLFPAMEMGPMKFGGLVDPTGATFAVASSVG